MYTMKHFIYLSLLAIGVRSFYIDDEPMDKDKIIGGKKATIKKFSYQGQLIAEGRMGCGVTIISEYWLLTAAHCARESQFLLPRTILTGTRLNNRGGTSHEIDYMVEHPLYNNLTDHHDIALIKLKKPIVFNDKQQPIPLTDRRVKVGDKVTISGFGLESNNGFALSKQMLKATVYVTELEPCREVYYHLNHNNITSKMFCAWALGKDACQGDSGGPAVVDGKLAGVVSFGDDCGSIDFPGVYTQVHSYLDWIAEVMSEQKHGVELYNEPNVHKDPEAGEGSEEEYSDEDNVVEDYYDDGSKADKLAKKLHVFANKLKLLMKFRKKHDHE